MGPRWKARLRPAGARSLAACLLALACACCACPASAAPIAVEIDGVEERLEEAVRAGLSLSRYTERDVPPAQLRRLVSGSDAEIRRALEAFGYYDPTVTHDVERSGEAYRVVFQIDPGQPVVVRRARVAVQGPAAAFPRVRAALEAFEPEIGEAFEHGAYEASKQKVGDVLGALGYVDAEIVQSRVEVVTATRAAHIDLVWDPGERHRFGEVHFSEAPFPESFLQGFVPWEPGDPYTTEDLLILQERLVATGYFASVSVQPSLQERSEPVVPVEVLLVPDEQTAYSAGVFASTDFGPGGRLEVDRRWVNRRGHTLTAEVEYASNLQQGSLSYGIPQPGAGRPEIRFGAAFTDEETDSTTSRSARIAVAATRQQWYAFTRSVGLQYVTGDFEVANETGSSSLVYADLSLSRIRSDRSLFPQRGYSVTLGLRVSPIAALSDTRFTQAYANARWVRALGPSTRILAHGALGATSVDEFDELPPQLRFFAGGDRSIRGFDYEEIGATNRAGEVIGGEYLATAGVELEHYVLERWGAAAFVDAGDAFHSSPDVQVGAGLGLRWKSPIGVVRLDVAHPVRSDAGDGWRLHLVIGPDL